MVSCCFLADALRRLRNSFQINSKFSENKRTMILHVSAIIGSQLALFALILIMDKAISSDGGYKLRYNLIRILFTITFAVSQAVFIYLLIQFQKPIKQEMVDNDSSVAKSVLIATYISSNGGSGLFDHLVEASTPEFGDKT